MIRELVHTALLVREYEEAKRFYCEKLGFEIVEDTPLTAEKRWVRIRPPGTRGSGLLLSRAVDDGQRSAVGNQTGGRVLFFLHTDNFEADYRTLAGKGVEFVEEPRNASFGTVAVFKDLYGNRIDLIQPTLKSPRQVLSEWIRLMNTHEPEALAALYDEDATNLQVAIGKPLIGRKAILNDFRTFFQTSGQLYESGEPVRRRRMGDSGVVGRRHFPADRESLALRGCGFFRVKDDRIVFQRGYWDKFTWFAQIGLPVE
jgi:catechol 2,3-dioxygenase-like lactoylglutathione lyase family enzyme